MKPVPAGTEPMPLGKLGPGLSLKLARGVRGDDALAILLGRHRPEDHPRNERRLADPVAGGDRDANDLLAGLQIVADCLQLLGLPLVWADFALKFGARQVPGEQAEDETIGVVRAGGNELFQALGRLPPVEHYSPPPARFGPSIRAGALRNNSSRSSWAT